MANHMVQMLIQRLFCGASFLGSVAPDESMPHMIKYHGLWVADDGNHVMV
jgi:hypothetical protein